MWADLVSIACDVDVMAGIEPHMLDETCNRSGFLNHVRKTGEVIYEEHAQKKVKNNVQKN